MSTADHLLPTETQLRDAIIEATRTSVSALRRDRPEQFYWICLVTTGEAHAPILSAWSHEALRAAVPVGEDPAQSDLKWSYADSPYLSYSEPHFDPVRQLFRRRPAMTANLKRAEWQAEYALRLRAMEAAMAALDEEGLFGSGDARLRIVVNVEVIPPDYSNTERAIRLNPPEAITLWLAEASEE